jgi:hypothetical protein
VLSFVKLVPEVEFGHGAMTPWNATTRRTMVLAKKNEDEDFPNPRFN